MSKENPFIVPKPDHSSAPKEPVEQGNPQKRRVRELAVALRRCKGTIPKGDFCVDAEALRQARAATPAGELHSLRSSGGCIPSAVGSRCVSCGQRHLSESCSSTVTLNA